MTELAETWMLCDTGGVGKFYITYPRVLSRSARASPAVKHGVSPPGTVDENIPIYCCPVNFQTAQESSPKPFRIGLRGFFFKKQAP